MNRFTQTPAPRRWPSVDASYRLAIVAVLVFYAIGVFATRYVEPSEPELAQQVADDTQQAITDATQAMKGEP